MDKRSEGFVEYVFAHAMRGTSVIIESHRKGATVHIMARTCDGVARPYRLTVRASEDGTSDVDMDIVNVLA